MGDSEYVEHRYLTDDRDSRRLCELVVYWAPNGDYYVGSAPQGEHMLGQMVRICTSGGAASANPKLVKAVRAMFQALGGWDKDLATATAGTDTELVVGDDERRATANVVIKFNIVEDAVELYKMAGSFELLTRYLRARASALAARGDNEDQLAGLYERQCDKVQSRLVRSFPGTLTLR